MTLTSEMFVISLFLGCLEIGPHSKGSRLAQWRNVFAQKNEAHTGTHSLCIQPLPLWGCASCYLSHAKEQRPCQDSFLEKWFCCSRREPSKCNTIWYMLIFIIKYRDNVQRFSRFLIAFFCRIRTLFRFPAEITLLITRPYRMGYFTRS